jgi:hypothetical protein
MTTSSEEKADAGCPRRVTRRDLLRTGVVAGGTLLWLSPVIQSTTVPAYAANASPAGGCLYTVIRESGTDCPGLKGTNVCTACTEVASHHGDNENPCEMFKICVKRSTTRSTVRGCTLTLRLADPHHRSCDQCSPYIPRGFTCSSRY